MNQFKQNVMSIYGEEGKQWLNNLPEITSKLAEKYTLTRLSPVSNMTFNYVASGYQGSRPIILKLGLNSQALRRETHCLKAFANHAAADVIAHEDNMILIERAVPGTTLKEYFPDKESEATEIVCSMVNTLHTALIPDNHNFYPISHVLKPLDQGLDIPMPILSKARRLRDHLLSSTDKEVLLHGDLHHDNILNNSHDESRRSSKREDGWLVIDPMGFIGDPAFEPAAFLCNPIPELLKEKNVSQIIADRIHLCHERLRLSEQRIKDWLYVKSVLCWAWRLEDNLDPGYFERLITVLDSACKEGE